MFVWGPQSEPGIFLLDDVADLYLLVRREEQLRQRIQYLAVDGTGEETFHPPGGQGADFHQHPESTVGKTVSQNHIVSQDTASQFGNKAGIRFHYALVSFPEMDGHTRQDGHALADLGGTGRNLLHIGKHMDKHDRQMGRQQFQHGPLSGKDTHEIRMHVHLVYAAFLVLESDQHMVQGDFERLEETAGEELLLPVDTDFIQHLLLRSLYDALPEGIFHKNLYQSEKISKEQVLDEIRIHREEEFFARRFFKPFEISLDHMLVAFQNKERRIDEMNVHPDFVSIFSGQWPVLELLPTHLAVMLVHMLAYMEQITASLSKTGECMTILTGVPVHIKRGDKCVVEVDSCLIPKLGSCILGDDMVLGNSFADGTYQMLVEIGPLSARRMENFFPGAADSKILNALTELFLPSDKEIQIRYIIQQEDARFWLGTPIEQGAYLGISTYL